MKETVDFEPLRKDIKGELFTNKIRRILMSTDASIYKTEPAAIIYPKDSEDVIKTVKFAGEKGLSVHPRGSGSGLCGSAIGRGIIIDFTKYMNKLISLSTESMTFTCEPGYKPGELDQVLKGSNLFFPPDPSSAEYATFGGMYGTNAGGARSVKYGNVADYIIDAEIVFADGSKDTLKNIKTTPVNKLKDNLYKIYELINDNKEIISKSYPETPSNVAGYNLRECVLNETLRLDKLMAGSEGTLGIVTQLTFRLERKAKYKSLIVAYFTDSVSSSQAALLSLKLAPASIEIMDKSLLNIAVKHDASLAKSFGNGDYDNILLIEFEENDQQKLKNITQNCVHEILENGLSKEISLALSEEEASKLWAVRKAAVPILYLLKGQKKIAALVEDASIPMDKMSVYIQGLYDIFKDLNVEFVLYGHIAKGLLHTRPLLNLKENDKKLLKIIADRVFMLITELKGTVSGEHGDGRIRSCYLTRQYKDIYCLFIQIKNLLDPNGILNPEIITYTDEYQMQKNLRFYETYSSKPIDNINLIWDNITEEIEKCHGCSKCTTVSQTTRMCPVYKVHRDEISAPKAKANILRALISGEIEQESLYKQALQDVMERCINCGSCFIECPSKVNIPKMVIETKSHYKERYEATIEDMLTSNYDTTAKYFRKIFPFISPILKIKPSKFIFEKIIGISSKRDLIKLKMKSLFDKDFTSIKKHNKKVIYFTGCYSSYSRPEIAESVIKLLDIAGYETLLPEQNCCGLAALSKGMVSLAGEKIEDNIKNWGRLIDTADYIVVSCSSCLYALTKEWQYILGGDMTEKISKKTVHISKIILDNINKFETDGLGLSVVYHMPCHMKVSREPNVSINMINKLNNININSLKDSCCGMAGSWGMSEKNYEESVKIASVLINDIRNKNCDICVTDCPTCEIQIKQLVKNITVMHPAEIVEKILK